MIRKIATKQQLNHPKELHNDIVACHILKFKLYFPLRRLDAIGTRSPLDMADPQLADAAADAADASAASANASAASADSCEPVSGGHISELLKIFHKKFEK